MALKLAAPPKLRFLKPDGVRGQNSEAYRPSLFFCENFREILGKIQKKNPETFPGQICSKIVIFFLSKF